MPLELTRQATTLARATGAMTLSLGRVLYRGLLRCGRRIDAQIQRHGTVDVFPEVRARPPSHFNMSRAKPARDLARRRGRKTNTRS